MDSHLNVSIIQSLIYIYIFRTFDLRQSALPLEPQILSDSSDTTENVKNAKIVTINIFSQFYHVSSVLLTKNVQSLNVFRRGSFTIATKTLKYFIKPYF